MQQLTEALRAGHGTSIPVGGNGDLDVVLASSWKTLWATAEKVLPLSFGQVGNRVDAALALLLDYVVSRRFGQVSTFGPDAAVILGLDQDTMRRDGPAALAPIFERLAGGTESDASAALVLLRHALRELGSHPIRRLSAGKEAERVARLVQLGRRLGLPRLVPGLTIHQAKGREWDHVGVVLQPPEVARLNAGLSKASETDRALYVALTRARRSVASI